MNAPMHKAKHGPTKFKPKLSWLIHLSIKALLKLHGTKSIFNYYTWWSHLSAG